MFTVYNKNKTSTDNFETLDEVIRYLQKYFDKTCLKINSDDGMLTTFTTAPS